MASDTLVSVGVVLAGVAIDSLIGCSVCQFNYSTLLRFVLKGLRYVEGGDCICRPAQFRPPPTLVG